MKPIIALTDFSAISINAARYAADMATSMNTNLTLLHVCLVPMTFSEVPYPPEQLMELLKTAENNIAEIKAELDQRTAGRTRIDTIVTTGTLIPVTENYCETQDPYAVVMGTQGMGAVQRVFFGTNTLELVRHLAWPLIVVPPDAKFVAIRKIGLACDMEDVDETVPFDEIKQLVDQFKAELHILHVAGKKPTTGEKAAETVSVQNMLQEQHPVYHFLADKDIEVGLERFAEENQLDLLIVVPKKHDLVDRLLHGSHSKRLVLRTHVPIVAVHE
jgi:nucleotide-binding universal stress UspA family protein